MGSCGFIVKTTMIYSLGHGLHNLTAVPTHLLNNNNKWRWWVWLSGSLQADSQPGSFGLVWGRQPLGTVPYSSHEPGALAVALSYDDSTINIVVVIIILYYYTYTRTLHT